MVKIEHHQDDVGKLSFCKEAELCEAVSCAYTTI